MVSSLSFKSCPGDLHDSHLYSVAVCDQASIVSVNSCVCTQAVSQDSHAKRLFNFITDSSHEKDEEEEEAQEIN